MKALIAAAALAALPLTAQAVTVSVDTYATYTGVVSAVVEPIEFSLTKALTDIVFEVGFSGGSASYTTTGFASSLAAGSVVSLYLSDPTFSFTGFTATIYGTEVAPIPVPAAGLLAGAGIVALGALRARRKKA